MCGVSTSYVHGKKRTIHVKMAFAFALEEASSERSFIIHRKHTIVNAFSAGLGADCGSRVGYMYALYTSSSQVRQHSFVDIGPDITSTAILSLPLIQEWKFSVTGKRMCTKYWYAAPEACQEQQCGYVN